MPDIVIIGYGFSGGMVLANLVQQAHAPLSIAIIDGSPHAMRGTAYGTRRMEHVLNVRAGNMGAFADDVGGFQQWRSERDDAADAQDFAPRTLYGEYLESIQRDAAAMAQHKSITLQHIAADVQHIAMEQGALTLTLTNGKSIYAAQVVVATGNVFSTPVDSGIARAPWFADIHALVARAPARVALIGSGLTAMDTIISLLDAGYAGEICCISRHGWLPQPHVPPQLVADIAVAALMEGTVSHRLYALRRMVQEAATQHISWHAVIDALRPHTVALWQSLPVKERQRFMRRVFTLWNVHRHRMDAALYARITAAQNLHILKASFVRRDADGIVVACHGQMQHVPAPVVFDCRGPSYRALPSFVQEAVDTGLLTMHPVGGLRVSDGDYRVSTAPIYAIGTPLIGERLETTAVPELRVQAQAVARQLLAS